MRSYFKFDYCIELNSYCILVKQLKDILLMKWLCIVT